MRITKKLGILVAVPLCAVSGFGALALVTSTSGAISAGHLYTLMNSATAAGDLVAELQAERTQVASYLTSAPGSDATALNNQIAKTQAATAAYEDKLKNMPWLSSDGKALLSRIDGELRSIDTLRHLILGNSPKTLSSADFQYHIVIADLLSYHDLVQNSGASNQVATMLRATSALSEAREALSGEEADVLRTMGEGQTASAAQDLIGSRSSYASAMESFGALAPASWQDEPNQVLGGAGMSNAGQLEDAVAQTPTGAQVSVPPQEWTPPLDARLRALDGVRHDMDLATLDLIAKDRTHQRELAGIEAAAIAGTVLLALMVSLRLGRPIIKGLRGLRDGAHAVAFEDLPAAVQALRSTGSLTGQTPEEFADEAAGGLPVKGDDEIAAVARAFNAVRREAIRTAAEQVLLRAGVGAAFVALARRGERLTGALTLELDKAERDEQDPDRLARLFVLDHLAARMTRNNESLLVLGGEGTVRVRDEGVPLIDVIRGARRPRRALLARGPGERRHERGRRPAGGRPPGAPVRRAAGQRHRLLLPGQPGAGRHARAGRPDHRADHRPRHRHDAAAPLGAERPADHADPPGRRLGQGDGPDRGRPAGLLVRHSRGAAPEPARGAPSPSWSCRPRCTGCRVRTRSSFASLPATAVNSLAAAMGQTGGYNPSAPAPMPSVGRGFPAGSGERRPAAGAGAVAHRSWPPDQPPAGPDPSTGPRRSRISRIPRRPSPFPYIASLDHGRSRRRSTATRRPGSPKASTASRPRRSGSGR